MAKDLIELLEKISPHGDWNERIRVPNDINVLFGQIRHYDISVSFVLDLPIVTGLLKVQKMFNIQGYHLNPIRVFKIYASYIVDQDFPFTDRINEMICRIDSTGLLRNDDERFGEFFIKYYMNLKVWIPFVKDEENFPLPMVVVFGWISSVIVFLIEIIWKKFNLSTETIKKCGQRRSTCVKSLRSLKQCFRLKNISRNLCKKFNK